MWYLTDALLLPSTVISGRAGTLVGRSRSHSDDYGPQIPESFVGIELSKGIQTGNEPGALRTTDVCRDHHHSLHNITGRFGTG